MDTKEMLETLEDMVDSGSIGDVLETLIELCHEKAEHLRSNWGDDAEAKAWERDGRKIGRLIGKLEH